jgi:hypothetical protein
MTDKGSFFTKWVATFVAAGGLLLGIINSQGLSEVQKYFAGVIVLMMLLVLYAEGTYEKKDHKKVVKASKSKGGSDDV